MSLHAKSSEFHTEPENRQQLEAELRKTKKSAYAPGTFKNLVCQWRAYFRFAKRYKIFEWPVKEHTLCLFAQSLAYRLIAIKSIKNYINGLCTLHALMNVQPPSTKNIEVRLTIRALTKLMARETKRAQPLTPEILLDLFVFLNMQKLRDRVFWAILLIGFFGMLHKSNLVSDTIEGFDGNKQLTVGHILMKEKFLIIKVTWAKNIQNRETVLEILVFPIPGSPLCPVNAVKSLLSRDSKQHHPLFGKKGKPLFTYNQFQRKLRKTLRRAGYQEKLFSSHSMRCSGAGWAHQAGVPDSLIQVHGAWLSEAYRNYLSYPIEIRALVSLKMRNKILKSKF